MKKIYNNLSIENLIKTDWLNQFDVAQKYVINEGLKKNLDVSKYAKPGFNASQMNQIRLGLKDNLDVNLYANPKYNWGQMRGFREVLKTNLESEIKNEKNI